jgi:hypothetical protein
MKFDYTNPGYWPTQEEVLEVNARSIISDCRALISGTLIPRSFGNISSVWSEYTPDTVKMRKTDVVDRMRAQSVKLTEKRTSRARVMKLTRMLEQNGMDSITATNKALDLLKGTK